MARHDDAAKQLGALGAWALVPSAITYEPKINSRTVQGERTRDRSRQERVLAHDGADIVGKAQGGSGRTVNWEDRSERIPRLVEVPAESRADVSAHDLCKWGTNATFDIPIVNLDEGSYLRMMPEKALAKAEKSKKDL